MIWQALTSFIGSLMFCIIFNIPKSSLFKCGIVGMLGWVVYYAMSIHQINPVMATLFGAFTVAIISQIMARLYKTPMIIFSVAGIIPLVPGGMAYDAMRHFVSNDYATATSLAARAFMLSGSIAFGLIFSEVLNQLSRKTGNHKQDNN
ncbi:threonine/serine exporter family protein [Pullulanibacillus sp. KACC 23026]|uniref:threonine/serine exporter family protein n=1 Tax=Pullulanibacillus sp. KACC 23026 TaxID=3028315 RepID=UPI0023B14532|nr:threonine/serine exporter family protein [Pullulanibacillus sp. KACC 23026]WEG13012.1 threonine/serine exporter family protein [Pullulanibacillus sp. KACC 23026]